jgi:hypothetical protein
MGQAPDFGAQTSISRKGAKAQRKSNAIPARKIEESVGQVVYSISLSLRLCVRFLAARTQALLVRYFLFLCEM